MGEASLSERWIRQLERATNASPALGLRLAAISGAVLGPRLGNDWWPSPAELQELLGELDARTLRRLQRRIAAAELRNRAVLYLLRHSGPEALATLIVVRGGEALQRLLDEKVPVVVLWWHQGVARAVETALPEMGYPVFAATNAPRGPESGYRWQVVVDDPAAGSQFVVEALKEVKRGGVPLLSLDAAPRQPVHLPFFTGSLPIATGAGWLAAKAGARLVPATSRWVGGSAGIEVTLHEPVPKPARSGRTPAEWEREVLASGVHWFEDHLRRRPEDLGLIQIRRALEHPRSPTAAPSDDDFARLVEEFDAVDGS